MIGCVMTAILIIAKISKGLKYRSFVTLRMIKNKGRRKDFPIRQIKRAMCIFGRAINKIKQHDKLGTSPFVTSGKQSIPMSDAMPDGKQSVPMPHATHATHLCLPTIISSYSKLVFLYIINKTIRIIKKV